MEMGASIQKLLCFFANVQSLMGCSLIAAENSIMG